MTFHCTDEVSEFEKVVLPRTRGVACWVNVRQPATVVTRQQDDSERHGLGVALEFFDERAAFARLLLQDYCRVAQLVDEPSDRLARTIFPALHDEDFSPRLP